MSQSRVLFAALVLVAAAVAGCSNPFAGPEKVVNYTDLPGYVRDTTGRNESAWPDLSNATITVLDNGAFNAFQDAAQQFEDLTGITVKQENGGDTGAALEKLQKAKGSGKYDVVYGIDNMVYTLAVRNGDLVAYKPHLADRIAPSLVFFDGRSNSSWLATPVDHGYIAINIHAGHPSLGGASIDSLSKLRRYSDLFVTEDPQRSSPGLGFLLVTIAEFDENPEYSSARYDWKAYWTDLLRGTDRDGDGQVEGCVLVAQDWSEAYTQHFSAAGEWVGPGTARDKPIVVSYSESPAYEVYGGLPESFAAQPLVRNGTSYHQIQTMAIANGTANLQAAQAWIEFTLTDAFQELAAPQNAVYPAVTGIDVSETYEGIDPAPGSFRAVEFPQSYLAQEDKDGVPNLERWLKAWSDLYEDTGINCNLGAGGTV